MLKSGQVAPAITAKTSEGQSFELSQALTQGDILLVFFPKTFTPVCTKQACSLQAEAPKIEAKGIQAVFVSPDDAETTERFRAEYGLEAPFLLDPKGTIAKAYEVQRMGGMLPNRRISYRIGADGTIRDAAHAELMLSDHERLWAGDS